MSWAMVAVMGGWERCRVVEETQERVGGDVARKEGSLSAPFWALVCLAAPSREVICSCCKDGESSGMRASEEMCH